MAELLTQRVESHKPKTHSNLFTGNNQLGQQKEYIIIIIIIIIIIYTLR